MVLPSYVKHKNRSKLDAAVKAGCLTTAFGLLTSLTWLWSDHTASSHHLVSRQTPLMGNRPQNFQHSDRIPCFEYRGRWINIPYQKGSSARQSLHQASYHLLLLDDDLRVCSVTTQINTHLEKRWRNPRGEKKKRTIMVSEIKRINHCIRFSNVHHKANIMVVAIVSFHSMREVLSLRTTIFIVED